MTELSLTLTDDQLDTLADLVAERLKLRSTTDALVDAQAVADALGCSRDWVYGHAAEIGGVKVGNGSRPRWRFKLADALAAFERSEPTRATPRRRAPNGQAKLLPIGGER